MTKLDSKTLDDLCRTFKVSRGLCLDYEEVYNSKILPRIQKQYLAHLVASVEEMIDEKIRTEIANGLRKERPGEKIRRFSIVLSNKPPQNGRKAQVTILSFGAIIRYDERIDGSDLRICIAHEIGHLCAHFGLISNGDTEKEKDNQANTFAYFAISGKNAFYRDEVPKMLYPSEVATIDRIQAVCHTP